MKFLFAGVILYWLFKRGDLDFSLIQIALSEHPLRVLLCIVLILFSAMGTSFRWKMLLEIRSEGKLSRKKVMGLTWIGMLFSSILPGAVTGDVLKVVYAKDLDNSLSKTFLLTSAFLDRIIGLLGLLFLLGFFSILHYGDLVAFGPSMDKLLKFNFILFLGALIFFITLFLPEKIQEFLLKIIKKIPLLGRTVGNVFTGFWEIGSEKIVILKCLMMSIIFQAGNVFAIYVISYPFFNLDLSLSAFFTFIPLGFMCTAIPISPAGLGVGHAAFGTLFSYYGIAKGASLFNLYFLCMLLVNLMGVIPFLVMGKKSKVLAAI